MLALMVGKQDLTGEARMRDQDRGNPLAASNTLNRLELSTPESAATDRCKKIVADPDARDRLLVDVVRKIDSIFDLGSPCVRNAPPNHYFARF